jgi:hypothetical protein
MNALKLTFLSLVCVAVAKQDYYMTAPVAGVVWDSTASGSTCQVRWLYSNNEADSKKPIHITLMKGPANNGRTYAVLASDFDPQEGAATFPCPSAATGTDYFIKLGSHELNDFKYSHYFTIMGTNPAETTSSTVRIHGSYGSP